MQLPVPEAYEPDGHLQGPGASIGGSRTEHVEPVSWPPEGQPHWTHPEPLPPDTITSSRSGRTVSRQRSVVMKGRTVPFEQRHEDVRRGGVEMRQDVPSRESEPPLGHVNKHVSPPP